MAPKTSRVLWELELGTTKQALAWSVQGPWGLRVLVLKALFSTPWGY